MLSTDPDDDGAFVPIFSFKEEAETFLRLLGDEGKEIGWRSRETTAGELVSVLLAPCAQVKRVALDPLPLWCGTAMLPFVSVNGDRFVQDLLTGERRGVAGELVPAKKLLLTLFTGMPRA